MSEDAPVCLVTGVGPGTGVAMVKRFAAGGYRVAMLARTAERLREIESEVPGSRSFPCDVTDADALEAVVERVTDELGTPEVVVHNAVGWMFGNFLEIDPEQFVRNLNVNVVALLHLARATAPAMVPLLRTSGSPIPPATSHSRG